MLRVSSSKNRGGDEDGVDGKKGAGGGEWPRGLPFARSPSVSIQQEERPASREGTGPPFGPGGQVAVPPLQGQGVPRATCSFTFTDLFCGWDPTSSLRLVGSFVDPFASTVWWSVQQTWIVVMMRRKRWSLRPGRPLAE
jgi:hypothetical protein